MERLEKSSHKAAEELYKTAPAEGAPGAAGAAPEGGGAKPEGEKQGDVVDAEFKQVYSVHPSTLLGPGRGVWRGSTKRVVPPGRPSSRVLGRAGPLPEALETA